MSYHIDIYSAWSIHSIPEVYIFCLVCKHYKQMWYLRIEFQIILRDSNMDITEYLKIKTVYQMKPHNKGLLHS